MAINPDIRKVIKIGCRAAMWVSTTDITTVAPPLAAIWGAMIHGIAKEHEIPFDKDSCIHIATSILQAASVFMTNTGILVKFLTYTIATIFGVGINCAINYFYTWRLGIAFDEIFDDYGTDTAISKLAWIAIRKLNPKPTINEVKQLLGFINK